MDGLFSQLLSDGVQLRTAALYRLWKGTSTKEGLEPLRTQERVSAFVRVLPKLDAKDSTICI
ncbi:hypothetical protein KIPB_005080, partial [Kipferlia bialata]|eukprot:g5080.t1